ALNVLATVAAVIAAPIIALRVQSKLQYRADREREKVTIFAMLLSRRHELGSPEVIRSLNLIDVVFADHDGVREAWSRYYAAVFAHPWFSPCSRCGLAMSYRPAR
ncbi:MAG TPA: DUF6680 family protein, partial [Acetobacteraceae bacterium]|nr:DUF6680 family protein [Acetobacteraceae bacterium]